MRYKELSWYESITRILVFPRVDITEPLQGTDGLKYEWMKW